jgi:hypothetical protein
MVPVEVQGDDPRGLLSQIVDDGKIVVFNPFHSQVDDLGGNTATLQNVGQSKESHGQEVNPDEMADRPVIIGQLGDMEKNKIKATHGGNCKMLTRDIQPKPKKNAGSTRESE